VWPGSCVGVGLDAGVVVVGALLGPEITPVGVALGALGWCGLYRCCW
jgi:hypothetical protein